MRIRAACVVTVVTGLVASAVLSAQAPARQLFQSGRYQELVNLVEGMPAGSASPDLVYLLAAAQVKLGQADAAKAAFARLQTGDPWTSIGASGIAMVDNNGAAAVEQGRKAVAAAPDNFFAFYQLGLALTEVKDFAAAAAALQRATELDPTFAYAHYYAGMSYYNARQVDRMSTHFESFLKLAPEAPEKPAIETIMRSLRGR